MQAGMGKADIMFPIGAVGAKELNVRGSFRYEEGDYRVAIDLVSGGRVSVKELITNGDSGRPC